MTDQLADLDTIDPMHPGILAAYRGMVHGDDLNGVWDIEFPSIRQASAWAQTCEIEQRVTLRDDSQGRTFGQTVVIQYMPGCTHCGEVVCRAGIRD